MKGKQIKDLLQELRLLDIERDFSGTYKRDGYLPQWPNPRMGDPDFEYQGTYAVGDKDGTAKHQGSENKPWYQGISDFFGGFTNFLNMIGGVFKGIGTLPKDELFNQGYSWLNQFTGANLTGKEQQMNAFNAEQAALQRGWQERMSNTSFQRQVADMQAAGINPAMSMGSNGASTPSGSAASGNSSPAQAAAILEMILGAKKIQTEKEMNLRSTASAERIADITAKSHIRAAEIAAGASVYGSNKTAEGKSRENELREKELEMYKKESLKRIDLLIQQAKSEEEKAFYYQSYARLNNVNADKIEEMIPYEKAYMDASTEEKKAVAAYNWAQAAYQNGLIDNGMIQAVVKSTEQNANESEQRAIADRFENQLKHGYQPEGANYTISPWLQRVIVFLKAVSK